MYSRNTSTRSGPGIITFCRGSSALVSGAPSSNDFDSTVTDLVFGRGRDYPIQNLGQNQELAWAGTETLILVPGSRSVPVTAHGFYCEISLKIFLCFYISETVTLCCRFDGC